MPASANSIISVSDYNAIRTNINNVMGVGSGSTGYGQTVNSSAKTANDIVDQDDWDLLRYDIVNARIHQTGSAFSATTSAGGTTTTMTFLTASVGFLIIGMAVFGIGNGHPIVNTVYITNIITSGSNTIITVNAPVGPNPVGTGIIVYFGPGTLADVQSGVLVTATAVNAYENLAITSGTDAERFKLASGQFLTRTATDSLGNIVSASRLWSASTSPTFWKDEINCTLTATFASANVARYFFNSGGEIRIISSRTGGRSDQQNNAWNSLLSGAGQQVFGGQLPTTGFGTMNGQNFYRLTSTFQPYYSLASSSPYASNRYVLEARSNVANNSTGTATSIDIRIRFIGGYVDPGPGGPPFTNDEIDGTFSVAIDEKKASGKLLPSGDFTVTSPVYSITAIAGT